MDASEIILTVAIGLLITAVSVIAHMWVAYTKAPKLAVRGVKSWLEGEEGIQSLQNWFSKALTMKDKASGLTVTQLLARDAVGGLVSFVGSDDGKRLMENAGKSLISQARSYLESDEAVEALEAVGSRTVDAAVGYLNTDEGKKTVERIIAPFLDRGAKVAADGVKSVIGGFFGNVGKDLGEVAVKVAADKNPIVAALVESPEGKKAYKKYGPLIEELISKKVAGGAGRPSPSGGGWG
jgi:hypothetical protein